MSSPRSTFVVVGGGASGALTAARLLDEAGRRHRAVRVTLVDPGERPARGVAYSTTDDRHTLNVRASGMSAYPEDPGHFLRWAGGTLDPHGFAPRRLYGEYLEHVLATSAAGARDSTLRRCRGRAVAVEPVGRGATVVLDTGERLPADAVVLALGHLGIRTDWAPAALVASPRFVPDPWAPGALASVPVDGDVLLVGSGLTAVDCLTSLARTGRTVHSTSRHGRLPRAHTAAPSAPMAPPTFEQPHPGLAELRGALAAHIAAARRTHGDWRPAVDSLRPLITPLWAGLSDADRREFRDSDAGAWETLRHRMSAQTAADVHRARADGTFVLHAGRVTDVTERAGALRVELSDGTDLEVAAVVNCTGPCDQPAQSRDVLVADLVARGLARPGPLGIGFDTGPDGALAGAGGRLWALGPLRRGTLWESTAIPEIRQQAATLAATLLDPVRGERRPRDAYDLPLSTTPAAAAAWDTALEAVLELRAGAAEALSDAVTADPGFAVGHATLALLAHEQGGGVDVRASADRARAAVERAGDAREKSFVQTVVAWVAGPPGQGDAELCRHVRAYPRDALAVTMALPTIASTGLAQPVEDAWALVDSLAPGYGDDAWFAGVRAFFAQERGRWDEAELLAADALARRPRSGHPAHARAHVGYETGQHAEGLRWLDGWLATNGPACTYRAHFEWHAALHELALDDPTAVGIRYAEHLAPPAVSGARALVDTASLLWRSQLAGCWTGDIPIAAVLAAVPTSLLRRPPTPFDALHVLVALAAAGDADGIDEVARYALGHPTGAVFHDVIAPLAEGMSAFVRGRPAAAADLLAGVLVPLRLVGGSDAQRQVVEDTLLAALIGAERRDDACALLRGRLDRQSSASDRRRHTALHTAAPPAVAG